MYRYAFEADAQYDRNLDIHHNIDPIRWRKNMDLNCPIVDETKWSNPIKYLTDDNRISDGIRRLPANTGGVYIYYLQGISIPFCERYLMYVGRCHYSDSQHIKKRAKEYYKDERPMIKRMFRLWGQFVYYRYFPEIDNNKIDKYEAMLIRSTLPPFNVIIPDVIDVQSPINAFS